MHPNLQLISQIASLNYAPIRDCYIAHNVLRLTAPVDNQSFVVKHVSNLVSFAKSLEKPLSPSIYLEQLEAIHEQYPHAVAIIDNSQPFLRVCALVSTNMVASIAIRNIIKEQQENRVSPYDADSICQALDTHCSHDLSKQVYSKAVITGITQAEALLKSATNQVLFAKAFEPHAVIESLDYRDCYVEPEKAIINEALNNDPSLQVVLIKAFDREPLLTLLLCSREVAERVIHRCQETKTALYKELFS
ncbi:hypothetical protein [Photobacterium leiognathi]|uniref:hypothetical protein n=1 Tax=Photobacterium leiognathi TaxID=553611 RepID=UPI0029810517|nr:hypothetical protein [Photobacterium leiognathi]